MLVTCRLGARQMKRARSNSNYRPNVLYLHKDDKAFSLEGRTCSRQTGIDARQVKGDIEMSSRDSSCPKRTADDSERPHHPRLCQHTSAVVGWARAGGIYWIDKCGDDVNVAGRFRAIAENEAERSCFDLNACKLKRNNVGLFDSLYDRAPDLPVAPSLGEDRSVDHNLRFAHVQLEEFLVALLTP